MCYSFLIESSHLATYQGNISKAHTEVKADWAQCQFPVHLLLQKEKSTQGGGVFLFHFSQKLLRGGKMKDFPIFTDAIFAVGFRLLPWTHLRLSSLVMVGSQMMWAVCASAMFPESSSQLGKIHNQGHCWIWVLLCVCLFLPLVYNHHSTTTNPIL